MSKFVKADIERAKLGDNNVNLFDEENVDDDDYGEQPEWVDLVQPCADFHFESEFKYDDRGADYDWSSSQYQYPDNFGVNFLDNLKNTEEDLGNELSLLDVNISSLNVEQKIAFNLVMKTLIEFENNSTDFTPLRLIVAGSAGCGKSYLIKCLVKAVKMFYNFNKSVHVLCPTGNSANLISGVTIHSFFLNSNITQIKRF
jgi:hypothetical protein